MQNQNPLRRELERLDGAGYGAYKKILGRWDLGPFDLVVDHVQSDPYAPPSSVRAVFALEETSIPSRLAQTRDRAVAVADFLLRDLHDRLRQGPRELGVFRPGQEILERTAVVVGAETVEVRLTCSLPAAGRRIKGRAAARVLAEQLPALLAESALGRGLDENALDAHADLYLDQLALREELGRAGLVAFVGDGAVLPRAAGDTDVPLDGALPFASPESLRTSFDLPSGRTVTGMGIGTGITVVVGGGYHGKSTLLRAIERAVYPHTGGDGREWVAAVPDAVSIRAEDGRAVTGTDISPFIRDLPSGTSTRRFSTTNASGSTSQAANLAEALELGTSLALIDEDTSATNFMIRDAAMKELISPEHEPITPFVDRIRPMLAERGTSTIVVAGGTGAFFGVADRVIAMESYVPREVTRRAHEIAAEHAIGSGTQDGADPVFGDRPDRVLAAGTLDPQDARKPPRARGLDTIQLGREDIDLAFLAQLVDPGQTNALALMIRAAARRGRAPLVEVVRAVTEEVGRRGLDELSGQRVRGDLVMPRPHELHAAIGRYRRLRLDGGSGAAQ